MIAKTSCKIADAMNEIVWAIDPVEFAVGNKMKIC
jgi:hypothetical protein